MFFAISIHFIPYKLQPASKIWSWGRRWDDDLWRPASKKFKKRQMGQRKIRWTSRLRSLSKVPSMGFYWSRFVCRFNELLSSHVTCDKENASMRFARKAGKKVSPTFEGGLNTIECDLKFENNLAFSISMGADIWEPLIFKHSNNLQHHVLIAPFISNSWCLLWRHVT